MSILMNETKVAHLTGMSIHWLRRKRWSGDGIPYIKLGVGKRAAVRYRPEDVEAYVAGQMRKSTSDQETVIGQKQAKKSDQIDPRLVGKWLPSSIIEVKHD